MKVHIIWDHALQEIHKIFKSEQQAEDYVMRNQKIFSVQTYEMEE
jgi:hypothetical protein